MNITIASATWLATAMLHQEFPTASDFSVKEIVEKAKQQRLVEGTRPGLKIHVSTHCVANTSADPSTHRMLLKTGHGRRRLFRKGDPFHPDRAKGKEHPLAEDIPSDYRSLLDWYDTVYVKRTASADPPSFDAAQERKTEEHRPIESWLPRSEHIRMGSAGAIAIPSDFRQELGITDGALLSLYREGNRLIIQPVNDEFIDSLRGSLKGGNMLQTREREHRDDRY